MSDGDNSDKTIDMITKLNKLNKQTKGIADTLQKIMEKLDKKDDKTQDEVKEEVSKRSNAKIWAVRLEATRISVNNILKC